MKITADEFGVLKAIAEQVMLSGDFPARHRKYIPTATHDRRVYDRFDREGTTASILAAMLINVENGVNALQGVVTSGSQPPAQPKPAENDPFTEEALKGIAPGRPDSSILNPPGAKMEGQAPEPEAKGSKKGKVKNGDNS